MHPARREGKDGTLKQGADAIDNITIRHRDPHGREAWAWYRSNERALAFEDADEPVKIEFVYAGYLSSSPSPCQ